MNNKIMGKVLVKETGTGIPNLLVVVYDFDPISTAVNPASLASTLPGAGHDRLGSVLTDEQGFFELHYDDVDFQSQPQEKRPDLTLFVLAPEDILNENQPTPLPPEQRLLHYSNISRSRAGRTESYIIRLLAAQLDRRGIPYSRPLRGKPLDKEAVLLSLDASTALDEAVQNKLNEHLIKRLQKSRNAMSRAKQAFANFFPSSVPREHWADPTYFAPEDDLKVLQEKVIGRAIDRVQASGKRTSLKLALTEAELNHLDMTIAPDGAQTITLKKLLKHLEDKNQGAQFAWSGSSLPPCKEETQAEFIIGEITGNNHTTGEPINGPEGGPSNGTGTTAWTTDSLVSDMIARHMEHVTAAEAHLKYGIPERAQQDDLLAAINAFEIRGGPSDVTAYHDFHNLQIAFEHIWTEVFDDYLKGWGILMYGGVIGTLAGYEEHNEQVEVIETEQQLRELLETVTVAYEQYKNSDVPPSDVLLFLPDLTIAQWQILTPEQRSVILQLSTQWHSTSDDTLSEHLLAIAQELISTAEEQANAEAAENHNLSRLQRLLADLEARLNESFRFSVFAPDSINYGILVTYRQEWEPVSYQVGDLVSTIPLAPKETRRYTKKQVVKKSRAQKEVEDSLRILRRDSSDTKRVDAEIVERAVQKTNFTAKAEGSGNLGGVVKLSGSTGLEVDAEKSSTQTKKDFREAVLKAAEEYKHEHRLEVETTEADELEETSSGEITNPNDELTVTYMFYELQRRYEIREQIHRLTPVILVANEVPAPHHIDEAWLVTHDWILKRVILDDSFLPALDFLSQSMVGAEFSIEILRANVERQARVVEDLRQQIGVKTKFMSQAFNDMLDAMEENLWAVQRDTSEGVIEEVVESIFGEGRGEDPEVAELSQERAKYAFEQFEREVKELQSRLSGEMTTLDAASEKYATALQEHLNRKTEISRLRVHVKQNILYYMQAIWEHEPPDQRYFRLYNNDKATWLAVPEDYQVSLGEDGVVEFEFELPVAGKSFEYPQLVDIADLDNLLGFKGNYMIFPLKQNNFFTWYMMQPFLDEIASLKDADEFANYTTEELIENFRCRYQQNPDAFSEDDLQGWRELILQRLTAPRREKDVVIVPTNSLFIEALPGKHPLLEDFKLIHRALDVKKVQADVRHTELENVRIAARLLSGEREDPDIEKTIVIEGDHQDIIVPPNT